jgi:hypothetical protein
MKRFALLIALGVVLSSGVAFAQAVNANIQTTCTLDASGAAVPIGAWVLTVGAPTSPPAGAKVNVNNCNSAWTVTGTSTTGGNMAAIPGSTDNNNTSVTGKLLTDPFNFDGVAATGSVAVGNGGPTVSQDVPVTYSQQAEFADPAIKAGTGAYQITLVYTLSFL